MKMRLVLFIFLGVIMSSCRTEFEKIRTSNDPVSIHEKAHNYYENEDYVKANSLYEIVIPYYRGREQAEKIFYNYAYGHYHLGQYILASHYFKNFTSTFYNSDKREEAAYMSAYSHYKLSPSAKLDQSYSQEAIEAFQAFVNNYSHSDRVETCNELIDEMRDKMEEKAFMEGKLYYNIGQYISAVTSFDNMLQEFPDTKKDEDIRYLIVKAGFELAQKSIYTKQEERYTEVLRRYDLFVKKYPRSEYMSEIDQVRESTLEELKKFN